MTSHWHVPGRCVCLADHVKWTVFDVAVTFKRRKLQESPEWGNTRPTFYALRVLHLFPPWTGTNSSYHSTSQRFFFKKNHIYLRLTRAAIFTVAFASMMQLGSGTHRTVRSRSGKGGPQMGLLYKMQRTLLWLADADGSERIKDACGWGGGWSRADTRFNLAPALLALFGIVKDCASAWVVF